MKKQNRRWFLQALGSGVLAAGCSAEKGHGSPSRTPEDTGDTGDTGPDAAPPLANTGSTLDRRVPVSLTTATDDELDITLNLLAGTLPPDMAGHSFIVHPVPWDDNSPIFTGNGRVIRIDYHSDHVAMKARMAKTPCYYADKATVDTDHAFENQGIARMSMSLGARNMANTALLPMGDRLLLTYDAGRPNELDPDTMEIATAVGWTDEWRWGIPDWISWFVNWPFPPIMSTAHPAYDPQSEDMFSVDYGISLMGEGTFTRVLRWNGTGNLEGWELVNGSGDSVEIEQSIHQIAITRDHIIIADTAFLVEMDILFDAPVEAQCPDTVLWIVRRADLDPTRETVLATSVIIPREIVHFLADFNVDDGKIILHVAHNCAADASEFLEEGDLRADTGMAVRSALVGLPAAPTDLGALARYEIDTETLTLRSSELLLDDDLLWGGPALCTWHGQNTRERFGSVWWCSIGFSEELRLARVEDLYEDYPYRTVALDDLPTNGRPATLIRADTQTMEIADSYAFPEGRICLSPQFVPRSNATEETDGYIVCTMISDDTSDAASSGDELWIFDAANLAQGPLARLGHPDLNMPFTLHTAWMDRAPQRSASYNVDVASDLGEAVGQLDTDLQTLFAESVFPHFT